MSRLRRAVCVSACGSEHRPPARPGEVTGRCSTREAEREPTVRAGVATGRQRFDRADLHLLPTALERHLLQGVQKIHVRENALEMGRPVRGYSRTGDFRQHSIAAVIDRDDLSGDPWS